MYNIENDEVFQEGLFHDIKTGLRMANDKARTYGNEPASMWTGEFKDFIEMLVKDMTKVGITDNKISSYISKLKETAAMDPNNEDKTLVDNKVKLNSYIQLRNKLGATDENIQTGINKYISEKKDEKDLTNRTNKKSKKLAKDVDDKKKYLDTAKTTKDVSSKNLKEQKQTRKKVISDNKEFTDNIDILRQRAIDNSDRLIRIQAMLDGIEDNNDIGKLNELFNALLEFTNYYDAEYSDIKKFDDLKKYQDERNDTEYRNKIKEAINEMFNHIHSKFQEEMKALKDKESEINNVGKKINKADKNVKDARSKKWQDTKDQVIKTFDLFKSVGKKLSHKLVENAIINNHHEESYIYNYAIINGYNIDSVLEAAYYATSDFFANDRMFNDLDSVEYNIITEFCRTVPVSVLQSFDEINPYKIDAYNTIIESKEAEEALYAEAVTSADIEAFTKFASSIKKTISEIFNVSGLKEKNGNLMFKISDKNSDTGLGNYLTISLQEKNGQIKTIKHYIDDTSGEVGVPEEVDELSGKFLSSDAKALLNKFIEFLRGGPKVVFAEYYSNLEDDNDYDFLEEAFNCFAVNKKPEPKYSSFDEDYELDDDMYEEGFNFLFGKKNKESTTKDDTLSTMEDNNNVTLEDVEKRFNFTFPEDFKNGYNSPEFQEKLNAKGLTIKLGETVDGKDEVRVKLYHPNEFRMTQNYEDSDNPHYVPFGEFIDNPDNVTSLAIDVETGEIGTLNNGEFESQCNSFDQFEKNLSISSTPNFNTDTELDDENTDNNDSIDIDDSIDENPEGNDQDDSDIGIDVDDDSSDNNDTDIDMSVGDDNSFDAPANEDTTATEYFFDDYEDDDLYEEASDLMYRLRDNHHRKGSEKDKKKRDEGIEELNELKTKIEQLNKDMESAKNKKRLYESINAGAYKTKSISKKEKDLDAEIKKLEDEIHKTFGQFVSKAEKYIDVNKYIEKLSAFRTADRARNIQIHRGDGDIMVAINKMVDNVNQLKNSAVGL